MPTRSACGRIRLVPALRPRDRPTPRRRPALLDPGRQPVRQGRDRPLARHAAPRSGRPIPTETLALRRSAPHLAGARPRGDRRDLPRRGHAPARPAHGRQQTPPDGPRRPRRPHRPDPWPGWARPARSAWRTGSAPAPPPRTASTPSSACFASSRCSPAATGFRPGRPADPHLGGLGPRPDRPAACWRAGCIAAPVILGGSPHETTHDPRRRRRHAADQRPAAPGLVPGRQSPHPQIHPRGNLANPDPIWTTTTVARNHGFLIYDTLFGVDSAAQPEAADVRRL